MVFTHLILVAGWILYGIVHSILADQSIKSRLMAALAIGYPAYRVVYNIIATIGLIALIFLQVNTSSITLVASTIYLTVAACTVMLLGAIVMLISIFKYFRQLSGIDKTHVSDKLETSGLHQYVRHPLYSGTFIFLLGLFLAFPLLSNLISFSIIIIYTVIGAGLEERKLILVFGNAYAVYRTETPMIVPFLKKKF